MSVSTIKTQELYVDFEYDIEKLNKQIEKYTKIENAIKNSPHYLLLQGKTQTFGKYKSLNKDERSRLIHTNQIATQVCDDIVEKIYAHISDLHPDEDFDTGKENEEIFQKNMQLMKLKTRCIARAHDIGHVAFGHEGERAIDNYLKQIQGKEVYFLLDEHEEVFGKKYEIELGHISSRGDICVSTVGFEHNELGAIQFNKILKENGIELEPEEKEELIIGILAHSTSRVKDKSLIKKSLPAQIVRIADKIEYDNYDWEELKKVVKLDSKIDKAYHNYLYVHNETGVRDRTVEERIDITNTDIAKEAFVEGYIWNKKPTMIDLQKFRGGYDQAIFYHDPYYIYDEIVIKNLCSRVNNPEALRKYYEQNPGVDFMFPETKVREIYEKENELKELKSKIKADGKNNIIDDMIRIKNLTNELAQERLQCKSVMQGENSERISCIFTKIIDYYYHHPEEIPTGEINITATAIDNKKSDIKREYTYYMNSEYSTNIQKLVEYMSTFDDVSLMEKYDELCNLRIEKGIDKKTGKPYGIEPVTAKELKEAIIQSYEEAIASYKVAAIDEEETSPTFEQKRVLYNAECKKYYNTRLTDEGKKVREENYKKRFKEYAKDKELIEKMIKADLERGILPDEKWSDYIENIEPLREDVEKYLIVTGDRNKLSKAKLVKNKGESPFESLRKNALNTIGNLGQKMVSLSEQGKQKIEQEEQYRNMLKEQKEKDKNHDGYGE